MAGERTMIHYWREACQRSGMRWDWDNTGELQGALEAFADQIQRATLDKVEPRLAALEEKINGTPRDL